MSLVHPVALPCSNFFCFRDNQPRKIIIRKILSGNHLSGKLKDDYGEENKGRDAGLGVPTAVVV
jgi:hypothetical protein